MASSLSPNRSSQSNYGGSNAPQQDNNKNPLSSLGLNFLKTLTEKKTTSRDGNPPKRRGPKPDTKPALTRRQELNRQAQRTHRERKELYIKALEDEVLRLKEIYSNISQDKERLAEENRQLKALLAQNGSMSGTAAGGGGSDSLLDQDSISNPSSNPSVGYTPGGSVSGVVPASSYSSPFTPPPLSGHSGSSGSQQGHHQHHRQDYQQHSGQAMAPSVTGLGSAGSQQSRSLSVDYDQAGIDFVLTYENSPKAYMTPPSEP